MTLSTVFQKLAANSLEIGTFFVLGLNRITCWKVKIGGFWMFYAAFGVLWRFWGVFCDYSG